MKQLAIEHIGDNMAYKIDPITGQIIKNPTDQAIPTNKQFNSNDYIGYSKNFDNASPVQSKVDSIVPIQKRQSAMEEPESGGYAALAAILRNQNPGSAVRDDEMSKGIEYKQGTPEYEKNVLAEGLQFDDEQDSQLQQIDDQINDPNVNDNEAKALTEKYDQIYDAFINANKSRYPGGR